MVGSGMRGDGDMGEETSAAGLGHEFSAGGGELLRFFGDSDLSTRRKAMGCMVELVRRGRMGR